MAEWYGTCRSNYFQVKNEEEFLSWIAEYEVEVISKNDDEITRYGFLSRDEYGDIPRNTIRLEDGDFEGISILDEISTHLAEGETAIIMEVGSEKFRYLTGLAIAIHHTGDCVEISLDRIYDCAFR